MDYKEEYKKYLDVNKDNFKEKWGNLNFVEEDKDVVINKWLAIHDVFFDFTKHSDKSKNIWFNEIREIALFNLFNIDPEGLDVLDVLNGDGLDDIKEKLKGLHEEWTSTVLECAEKEIKGDYTINSFTKKGGQGTSHDFELSVTSETNEMKVKIEFKFSNSKSTSVADLAEFAALNTESASSFILFKNDKNEPMSYLNYFWDKNYLKDMCSILNLTEEETPTEKKTWMTTAKSVAVPKSGPTKKFHERLREADVTSNKEKKNLVNKSFDEFIQLCSPGFDSEKRKEEIASIFNGKQEGKYFCIFNKGGFTIDSVPKIVIKRFYQDPKKKHVFYLECESNISIQCGMSWGNGGAGNQNPRILFKLIPGEVEPPRIEVVEASLESESKLGVKNADEFIAEPPEIESTDEVPQSESKSDKQRAEFIEEAVKVGGEGEDGSCDDESCDKDWFIYDEELAIGDTLGKKERDQLLEITNTEKDVTKKIDKEESNQLLGMTLRSGKTLKGLQRRPEKGGKKRSKKVKTGQKTTKRTKKSMKKKKLFVLIRTKKGNRKIKKTKRYCRK